MQKVLITTASFSFGGLHSTWVEQVSEKYSVTFNRIDDRSETPREKAMHPRLRGKIPKMIVWEDFPDFDYYVWLDCRFSILQPDSIERFVDECSDVDACFFNHCARTSVKQELDFVVSLMEQGNQYLIDRYQNERMTDQVESYLKDKTWNDNRLFECGAFVYSKNVIANRDHNLMKEWFYQNCIWSVQDQLSLPYLLHKFQTNYKTFPGNVYDNSFIK
jgi:hypothetical protein